ncbi:hypothetical protein FB567DRAFT_594600 [Paraphoma chrysanthemicola]|uniref:Uncharacterized protein n=1 Tax=Paraphoma chrysanthemicola TaxID=798071 RepID=A0A8K0QZQ4_9PLEO|nr:hypothetical protein FB567DRAFT_594600 [Paraphoma chrysanthemicola]
MNMKDILIALLAATALARPTTFTTSGAATMTDVSGHADVSLNSGIEASSTASRVLDRQAHKIAVTNGKLGEDGNHFEGQVRTFELALEQLKLCDALSSLDRMAIIHGMQADQDNSEEYNKQESIDALLQVISDGVARLNTARQCALLTTYPYLTKPAAVHATDDKACLIDLAQIIDNAIARMKMHPTKSEELPAPETESDESAPDDNDVVLTDLFYKPTPPSATTPSPTVPSQHPLSAQIERPELKRRTTNAETTLNDLFFSIDESLARLQSSRLSGQATVDRILDAVLGPVEKEDMVRELGLDRAGED